MKKIAITGSKGQLGTELNFLSSLLETNAFSFFDKNNLDISDEEEVNNLLSKNNFDVLVNCAAYTAVDNAESEKELAFRVNETGAENLASACSKNKIQFIHISTDFVFDERYSRPILEEDVTNPLNVYGASKLAGEKLVLERNPEAIIIRTGWVYSSFGNNFVKTILRLCKERESLNVIYDQIGTPTYARDLAAAILQIISARDWKHGIYHFSNEGVASWYDFAVAIRDFAGLKTKINPIETFQYPTPATRSKYTVLNKRKIKETFALEIPYWRESLEKCVALLG